MEGGPKLSLFVAIMALVPGCLDVLAPSDDPSQARGADGLDVPRPWPMGPDCSTSSFEPTAGGLCALMFRSGTGEEWEPHIAAHPTDPDTILLTATNIARTQDGLFFDITIWAAMTHDGGATWNTQTLAQLLPEGVRPPGVTAYAFDSIAAFASDGTAYVLFGGENLMVGGIVTVNTQMTVAKSTDGGATWTFHPFANLPSGAAAFHDYMDLAVAPDTGYLYVATDTHIYFPVKPIWFYRSTDGAETWEGPVELFPPTLPGSEILQFARVAAGTGGLVVVSAFGYDPDADVWSGHSVWISRDGGATFAPPVEVENAPSSFFDGMQPVVATREDGPARIDIAYSTEGTIEMVRSEDAGATWSDRTFLSRFPEENTGLVFEAAGAQDGTLYILDQFGRDDDPKRFGIGLLRVAPGATTAERMSLVDTDQEEGAPYTGGHYGGVAVAADGSVWATWADPRGEGPMPIAVVHVL